MCVCMCVCVCVYIYVYDVALCNPQGLVYNKT